VQLKDLQEPMVAALVEAVKQSDSSEQYRMYAFGSSQCDGGYYGLQLNDELLNEIGAFPWIQVRAVFIEVAAHASRALQSQGYELIVTFDEDTGRAFFVIPTRIEKAIQQAAAELGAMIASTYTQGDHTTHITARSVLWPELLSVEVCQEIARRAYRVAHKRAFIEYTPNSDSFNFTVYH
jgi:hypothetical protein